MKVLTVDDSKTIRAVVAHYLTPLGLTVLQAADGLEGLEILRGARPDLAVLDVNMPNLDGMQLLAMKAKDPLIASIPVIMLTAGADQDFVLRCLKLGAKGYIVKPFEKKTLVQKVCKLLKIDPAMAEQNQPRSRGPVVLAVDRDEKELANLMEILMEGCELLTALDLRQATRMARERRPESVWVDVSLEPAGLRTFVEGLRAEGAPGLVALVTRGAPAPPAARELGIRQQLPKPFIRLEVREFAARHLGIFQRFLVRDGSSCVLDIPGDAPTRTRDWLPALEHEVRLGLERAATEGVGRLVLDFSRVAGAADVRLVSGVVKVATVAAGLNIPLLLAVPNEETLKSFASYQDLKGLRCTRGLREALDPPGAGGEAAGQARAA